MLIKVVGQTTLRDNVKSALHAPAANTAAIVTLAGAANRKHLIHHIQWSYSAPPVGGQLTVTINSVTKFDVDVTAGGPGGFGLELTAGANEAVVVTLAAGGVTVVGKLNVQYTTESDVIEHIK